MSTNIVEKIVALNAKLRAIGDELQVNVEQVQKDRIELERMRTFIKQVNELLIVLHAKSDLYFNVPGGVWIKQQIEDGLEISNGILNSGGGNG